MIFSGSCVVDENNTSGFAKQPGQIPMVAIYTGHIEGKNQSQHLAYSLDDGRTWTKYKANPVLDLGKKDFRDPNVFWYAPDKKWIMAVVLPMERQVQLYSSENLLKWNLLSSFGPAGDVTGIWECPGLFQVPVKDEPGKTKWVLMLSPAPYMQYFIGDFDGTTFKNSNAGTKIYRPDYGPDYYAAIAYTNLPKGSTPVSIGWVNNWNYAIDIPTTPWKSAMSLPRELTAAKINNEWILLQKPVAGITSLREKPYTGKNIPVNAATAIPLKSQVVEIKIEMKVSAKNICGIRLAKNGEHYIEIGYDAEKQLLYIDRSKSGDTSFNPAFAKQSRYEAPLPAVNGKINLHIFFDKSIVEVFANDGQAAMTAQLFPAAADNGIELFSTGRKVIFNSVQCWTIKPVW